MNDYHLFFRGISHPMGNLSPEDAIQAIHELLCTLGVGESDNDPAYVFIDYHLSHQWRPTSNQENVLKYDNGALRICIIVFNVFDRDGKFLMSHVVDNVVQEEGGL